MKAHLKEVTDKEYEEKLNDIYGTVEICGMTFDSGTALKEFETEEEANDCCQE